MKTMQARGLFDVKVTPLATDSSDPTALGRYGLDKTFHGDLEATSKGEMLTAGTDVKGSAGYVAIERVIGTLKGRRGTFVLLHRGTMSAAGASLDLLVLPDSGTDQLVGLTGTMTIEVVEKRHHYHLGYSLAEPATAPSARAADEVRGETASAR